MNILRMLQGDDLRSIGRADEVAKIVLSKPKLVETLVKGLYSDSPVLRARCADALEKVAAKSPEYVEPFKKELLTDISKVDQQEIKWHVALIVPRLNLSSSECKQAENIFLKWLKSDKSNIVRVCSLQALFDLSTGDKKRRVLVRKKLEELLQTGSPSLRSRNCRAFWALEARAGRPVELRTPMARTQRMN